MVLRWAFGAGVDEACVDDACVDDGSAFGGSASADAGDVDDRGAEDDDERRACGTSTRLTRGTKRFMSGGNQLALWRTGG